MVFEGILEILLQRLLGQYFQGLDKQNMELSLTAGHVILNRIKIKPSVVENLNLPISLNHNVIDRLTLTYPWLEENARLSIVVENVFVLVNIKHKQQWYFIDNLMKSKLRSLGTAIKQHLSKHVKKEGFFQNEIERIIRQLNITVNNIRLRCEYHYQNSLALLGFQIQSMGLQTLQNKEKQQTNDQKILQVVYMKNMKVYSKSTSKDCGSQSCLFFEQAKQQIICDQDIILSISVDISVQSRLTLSTSYNADLKIGEITIEVSYVQYKNMIDLLGLFMDFHNQELKVQRCVQLINPKQTSLQIIQNKLNNIKLKSRCQDEQTKKALSFETDQYKKHLRQYWKWTIKRVQQELYRERFNHILHLMRKLGMLDSQINLKDALKSLSNKKQFSRLSRQFKKIIKKTSINKLLQWAEQHFSQIHEFSEVKTTLHSVITFVTNIRAARFSIKGKQNSYGGQLILRELDLNIQTNISEELKVLSSVKDLKFNLLEKQGLNGQVRMPILKRINPKQEQSLFNLTVTKNLTGNSQIFLEIKASMRPIEFMFLGGQCKRLLNHLFDLKKMKTESIEQEQRHDLRAIKNQGYLRNIVDIRIQSPWIIIPFQDHNDSKGECWIIRCGDFKIKSGQKEQLIYHNYQLFLQQCTFKYFSSIQYFRDWHSVLHHPNKNSLLNSGLFGKGSSLNVIQQFSACFQISVIKDNISFSKVDRFSYMAIVDLPEARVRLNRNILQNIKMLISKLFSSTTYAKQPFSHTFPDQIERDTLIVSTVTVMHPELLFPTRYLLKLTDNHIYCYLSQFSEHFQLRIPRHNARVTSTDLQACSISLRVKGTDRSVVLMFEDQLQMQEWLELLNKEQMHSQEIFENKLTLYKSDTQSIDQHKNKKASRRYFCFKMGKVELLIYQQLNQPVWISSQADELKFQLSQNDFVQTLQLKVKGFHLKQHEQGQITPILSNIAFQRQKNLKQNLNFIEIKIDLSNPRIPKIINVGELHCSWKLPLLKKLREFFQVNLIQSHEQKGSKKTKQNSIVDMKIAQFKMYCYQKNVLFAKLDFINFFLKFTACNEQQQFTVKSDGLQATQKLYGTYEGRGLPIFSSHNNLQNSLNVKYLNSFKEDLFHGLLTVEFKNYLINYHHQALNRIIDWMLNSFIMAITSKFSSLPESSIQNIYELLENKKNTKLQLKVSNSLFRIPDQFFSEELLQVKVQQMYMRKQLQFYCRTPTKIPGKHIDLYYDIYGFRIPHFFIIYKNKVDRKLFSTQPCRLQMMYKKNNLNPLHFAILEKQQLIDKSVYFQMLMDKLTAEMDKYIFQFMLRVYYNNIKFTDDLNKLFESQLERPPKFFFIKLNKLEIAINTYFNSIQTHYFYLQANALNIYFSNYPQNSQVKVGTEHLKFNNKHGQPIAITQSPQSIIVNVKNDGKEVQLQIQIKQMEFNIQYQIIKILISFFSFSDLNKQQSKSKQQAKNVYLISINDCNINLIGQTIDEYQLKMNFLLKYEKDVVTQYPQKVIEALKKPQSVRLKGLAIKAGDMLIYHRKVLAISAKQFTLHRQNYQSIDTGLAIDYYQFNITNLSAEFSIDGFKTFYDLINFNLRQKQKNLMFYKNEEVSKKIAPTKIMEFYCKDLSVYLTGQHQIQQFPSFLVEQQICQFQIQIRGPLLKFISNNIRIRLLQFYMLDYKQICKFQVQMTLLRNKQANIHQYFINFNQISDQIKIQSQFSQCVATCIQQKPFNIQIMNKIDGIDLPTRKTCFARSYKKSLIDAIDKLCPFGSQIQLQNYMLKVQNSCCIWNNTYADLIFVTDQGEQHIKHSQRLYIKRLSYLKQLKYKQLIFQFKLGSKIITDIQNNAALLLTVDRLTAIIRIRLVIHNMTSIEQLQIVGGAKQSPVKRNQYYPIMSRIQKEQVLVAFDNQYFSLNRLPPFLNSTSKIVQGTQIVTIYNIFRVQDPHGIGSEIVPTFTASGVVQFYYSQRKIQQNQLIGQKMVITNTCIQKGCGENCYILKIQPALVMINNSKILIVVKTDKEQLKCSGQSKVYGKLKHQKKQIVIVVTDTCQKQLILQNQSFSIIQIFQILVVVYVTQQQQGFIITIQEYKSYCPIVRNQTDLIIKVKNSCLQSSEIVGQTLLQIIVQKDPIIKFQFQSRQLVAYDLRLINSPHRCQIKNQQISIQPLYQKERLLFLISQIDINKIQVQKNIMVQLNDIKLKLLQLKELCVEGCLKLQRKQTPALKCYLIELHSLSISGKKTLILSQQLKFIFTTSNNKVINQMVLETGQLDLKVSNQLIYDMHSYYQKLKQVFIKQNQPLPKLSINPLPIRLMCLNIKQNLRIKYMPVYIENKSAFLQKYKAIISLLPQLEDASIKFRPFSIQNQLISKKEITKRLKQHLIRIGKANSSQALSKMNVTSIDIAVISSIVNFFKISD